MDADRGARAPWRKPTRGACGRRRHGRRPAAYRTDMHAAVVFTARSARTPVPDPQVVPPPLAPHPCPPGSVPSPAGAAR
ncbi:hypothetical protein GCM10009834_15170 [Streptomonospora arabica]